ncbi:ABC transporter permease (plasmid) [Streptomyces sp. BI20]|uniref:ABC transporter permease n=1 Tax=Streptomyces sp. BI20 TaxID=3403460 RepID=UPI003C714A6E
MRRRALPLALAALVLGGLGLWLPAAEAWPGALTVDATGPLTAFGDWIVDHRDTHPVFLYGLGHVSNAIVLAVRAVYLLLLAGGWTGVLAFTGLFAWRLAGARTALVSLAALAACGVLGMWVPTLQTLSLMIVAVAASVLLGGLLGLAAGLSPRVDRLLSPVLQTMQVLPAFAYLLPMVLVFGIGVPAAVLATVVYAAPPMARFTALGLRGADPGVLEASASLGANARQRLLTARLPLARPQLLLGVNQTVMTALSMAVIASVIGAGGLGDRVYQALAAVDVGAALAAGVPIVLLAVVLDRVARAAGERLGTGPADTGTRPFLWQVFCGWYGRLLTLLAAVAVAVLGRLLGTVGWPRAWTVPVAGPVNRLVDGFTDRVHSGLPVVGGTADWAAGFTGLVLDPLRGALQGLPWWCVLLVAAAPALLAGTWRAATTAVVSLALVGVLGVWDPALDTLSQVLAALVVTLGLGFGVGVAVSRSARAERLLRPLLDLCQTLPQFVYLIPVVALFGVGRAPAAVAAVVYALPAVIRIVAQGLREVDPGVVEAARSLGASRGRQLRQVRVPLARPALLLAVNQAMVLVLSVVVVGGLVGGGALGYDVVFGLARGDLATGLVAGVAIVCLGVFLDRVSRPKEVTA